MTTMLSTVDNPFNPFDDYDAWYQWDTSHGYDSNSLLARIAITSHELPDLINKQIIEAAIDEIVKYNVSGVHIKIVRD